MTARTTVPTCERCASRVAHRVRGGAFCRLCNQCCIEDEKAQLSKPMTDAGTASRVFARRDGKIDL